MSINTGLNIGGSSIPQTGLKLWLDVGNPDSYTGTGTAWHNLCKTASLTYDADATITNANILNGHMDFDGTSDYASIAVGVFDDELASDIQTALSIVCWAESDVTLSGEISLTRKENQWQLGFDGSAGQVRNLIRTSGGTTGWTTANDDNHNGITNNVWNMWSFTWDGSTLTNYQNLDSLGTHSVTGTFSQTAGFLDNTVYIGAGSTTAKEWNGGLDILMIYNVGLTLAQLTQIYNVYRGRFGV
tara:strand:- start:76 stop:807 length:732 start_codon:yes stop_codon:yes gene_type:complete